MKQNKILLFFVLATIIFVQSVPSLSARPTWLEVGTYAEYKFDSPGIIWRNSSLYPFDGDAQVTWRWNCIELKDQRATLSISLNVTGANKNLFLSTEVFANTVTREISLQNGTQLGITHLWAPANPADGEQITLWDVNGDKIVGTVDVRSWSQTPQGAQKTFIIKGNGTIEGHGAIIDNIYDYDTGVMTDGYLPYEPTLFALDIETLLVNGLFSFVDTNVDLGPKELWPEIALFLPIVAVVIVFIASFILVYRYLSRKKRRR